MPTVRNLEVIKAMQSLTSKGFVKTQFSWQWYYYTLTDEGLAYLREWLHLPEEIVPQTHMKPARAAGRSAFGGGAGGERRGGGDGAYRAPRGDREYRKRDDAGEGGDKEQAGATYRPVSPMNMIAFSQLMGLQKFGGVGRGAPAPSS
jgi:small subunit ribosomal protein S10e